MAHHVSLDQFEGPLDLLLYLISKAQIDITEIFISRITEQYLSYMAYVGDDMNRSSEFLAMAARLLEIKSRQLLPKPRIEEEGEEDPEAELIRQLQEYKLYKMASEELEKLQKDSNLRYFRSPEENEEKVVLDFQGTDIQLLYEAFIQIQEKLGVNAAEEPVDQIQREAITIQEKIFQIRGKLMKGKKLSFRELFEGSTTRIEVIVTFMALLELIRLNKCTVSQDSNLEEMTISITGN